MNTQRTEPLLKLKRALEAHTIPGLDGFRAIAAFLVVFFHSGLEWMPGGLGVLGFFVLSGFLITWLLLKELDSTGTISLRAFYLRRALRIFPAFYVYWFLIVIVLGVALHKQLIWPQAISSFFYVNNYWQALNGHPANGISHTWSLAIEEQFYMLWPAALLVLCRWKVQIPNILIASVLALWAYRLFLWLVVGVNEAYIYEAFDARADHLLIGCLLAVSLKRGFFAEVWRSLCASPWLALLPLTGLVVSSAASYHWGVWYRNVLGFIVDPVLVAALIVQIIGMSDRIGLSWLNLPAVRFLGRISYSIYLYQQLVIHPTQRLTAGAPTVVRLVAVCIAVIVAGSASYFLVERPFLALKVRIRST